MQRCRAACSVDLATSPYLPAPGIYGSDFWEECRKEAGGIISCYSRLRSPPPRHPCPDSLLRPWPPFFFPLDLEFILAELYLEKEKR